MTGVQIVGAETIRRAVGFPDLIEPVAAAYAAWSRGLGEAPIMVFAPAGPAGDVHVKAAWLPDRPVYTVKVAGWFAGRAARGLPPGSGYLAVHDAGTGDLLALLHDEHHLTDVRTAAGGAVAARLLAPPDARTLAVLGTGVQAYLQTLAHCAVRPVDRVLLWGRRQAAGYRLREVLLARLPHLDVNVAVRAEDAVRAADLIVTATSSREPVLCGAWLRPGQHVTAVGADDLSKAELDPECFARADLLAVDSRADTLRLAGDLRAAVGVGAVTAAGIHAELGELVPGGYRRPAAPRLTVAKLVGIGVQDLAAAEVALRRLPADSYTDTTVPDRPPPAAGTDLTTPQWYREESNDDRP